MLALWRLNLFFFLSFLSFKNIVAVQELLLDRFPILLNIYKHLNMTVSYLILLCCFEFSSPHLCLSSPSYSSFSVQVIDRADSGDSCTHSSVFLRHSPSSSIPLARWLRQLFLGVSSSVRCTNVPSLSIALAMTSAATNRGRRVANEFDLLDRIGSKLRDIDPRFDLVIFNASHYTPLPLSDTWHSSPMLEALSVHMAVV